MTINKKARKSKQKKTFIYNIYFQKYSFYV